MIIVDDEYMRRVVAAMKKEENGKELKRDLTRRLREIAKPAHMEAKRTITAFPSKGGPRDGQPLRQAISQRTKIEVRMAKRGTGVKIRIKGNGMPRQFKYAARRLNRDKGWRHPVFGDREVWVAQSSPNPNWFDDIMKRRKREVKPQIEEALRDMARRIRRQAR